MWFILLLFQAVGQFLLVFRREYLRCHLRLHERTGNDNTVRNCWLVVSGLPGNVRPFATWFRNSLRIRRLIRVAVRRVIRLNVDRRIGIRVIVIGGITIAREGPVIGVVVGRIVIRGVVSVTRVETVMTVVMSVMMTGPVAESMSDAVAKSMSDAVADSQADAVTHVMAHVVADCVTQARPQPVSAGVTEAHRVTHTGVSVDTMPADAMAESRTRTMSDANAA